MNDNVDWEKKWQTGQTMWDAGEPSPALVSLLKNEKTRFLIPQSGPGLVPGCGSGYDVLFLANKDRHITGMDISPTCIDSIHKKLKNPDHCQFICGDFFKFEVPNDGYNLAYDYTFLCALPPVLRPEWASRYKEIIRKNGVLITLMFPIHDVEGGPPYAVSEQIYHDLLSSHFELIHIEDAHGHSSRLGREKIAIWRKNK